MFQYLQERDHIEVAIREGQVGGIRLSSFEPFDAACLHRSQKFDPVGVGIDGGDGQMGECVQQGSEECSPSAADVEERGRLQAPQHAQRPFYPGQESAALEVVKGQFSRVARGQDALGLDWSQVG